MKIFVTSGSGEGLTKLAAFDRALYDAGIANYNLIPLSSVIPKGSEVIEKKLSWNDREHGHKLYVVISDCREDRPGKEAWAGLGWLQDKRGSGRGIFMEATGASKEEVEDMIEKSLESLKDYRDWEFGEIRIKIASAECAEKPVCALVCAVFKSEGWD